MSAASSGTSAGIFELAGPRLTARFTADHGSLRVVSVRNAAGGAKLAPGEAFSLALRDGRVIAASTMKLAAPPAEATVAPRPDCIQRRRARRGAQRLRRSLERCRLALRSLVRGVARGRELPAPGGDLKAGARRWIWPRCGCSIRCAGCGGGGQGSRFAARRRQFLLRF